MPSLDNGLHLNPFLEILSKNEIHVFVLHDDQFEQLNGRKAEIEKQAKSFFLL